MYYNIPYILYLMGYDSHGSVKYGMIYGEIPDFEPPIQTRIPTMLHPQHSPTAYRPTWMLLSTELRVMRRYTATLRV